MVQLTIEQRVFVVLHYTKTQSIAAVQNAFLERFPDRNPPCKTTILRKNIQMPAQVLTLIKGIQAGEGQHERGKILRQLERCSRKIHV